MAKYHNQPDETRLALREGWLYTGDVACMDSDGYFYLVDRKKDVIKVGGLQVGRVKSKRLLPAILKCLKLGWQGLTILTMAKRLKPGWWLTRRNTHG